MNFKRFAKLGPLAALIMLFIAACECSSAVPKFPEHWSYTHTPTPTQILFDFPATSTPRATAQALTIASPVPQCPMTWQNPANSATLPTSGRVNFDWSAHPGANAYAVVLTQPNGSEIVYESATDSKDLFMENYTQAGEYNVEVQAFDASGQLLCSLTLKFEKDAPAVKSKPEKICREVCKSDPSCPPTVACAPVCTTVCK